MLLGLLGYFNVASFSGLTPFKVHDERNWKTTLYNEMMKG